MNSQLLISQLINGVGTGLIYFLVAVGFSVVFGLMNFVNFAHGAFFVTGAYFVYDLLGRGLNFWVALLLATLLVAALGLLVEQMALKRLYRVEHSYQIVATFAVALLFQELLTQTWGPNPISAQSPDGLTQTISILGYPYPAYRLFVVLLALVVAAAIFVLIERTRLGAMLRAGSENLQMASVLGLNVGRMFSLTFASAAGLAGLAGALSLPMRGVTPASGNEMLALAVAVVVVGKIGSYRGAFVAALVIGVVQSITVTVAPALGSAVVYALMVVALLARVESVSARLRVKTA